MLYVSPVDVTVNNGMVQRQTQIVAALGERYPGRIDVLSLYSAPAEVSRWLESIGVQARVLNGPYARLARVNALLWYIGNVILCNKLGWINEFAFPLRTPLPMALINQYDLIVSYYAWAFVLLDLQKAGSKVIADLGDVLGQRHDRIGTRRWITMSSRNERSILETSARCLAICEDDRDEFERLYGARLPVVPFLHQHYENLVALGNVDLRPAAGFLAARGYGNEQVLKVLCNEAFITKLRASRIPLIIAGGICETIDASKAHHLRQAGAVIVGHLGAVGEFYRQVGTVINPVGPSTGVKIKSVEALLAGRCVITTRYGADNLLRETFGPDIVLVKWPVDPLELAEVTVRTVLTACESYAWNGFPRRRKADATAKYVRRVQDALDSTFGARVE